MINKCIYKYLSGKCLSRIALAIVLSGIAILAGCSDEERQTDGSFFKISVKTEDYGNTVLTRAGGEAPADTVITPIDDDLYMETVLCNDTGQEGTTRASSTATADVKAGTGVTVLAYEGNTYKGKIIGTVAANGSVTMADNQLYLEPGNYKFVCLANVEIDPSHAFFYALKGKNSMYGVVDKTVSPGDQDCNLAFTLRHKVGQIRITIKSELVEPFNSVDASLIGQNYSGTVPVKQKMNLPSGEEMPHGPYETLNDELFRGANGYAATSKDENYYIAGYDYSLYTGITMSITAGTIARQSLAGKSVAFNRFDLQYNRINKAEVTFKRQSLVYVFSTATRNLSVAAAGGTVNGTAVSSTLNGNSQGWGIESLSTSTLTETGPASTDAVANGIVTAYTPQSYAGANNGVPSFTFAANTSTSPRTVYVRLKQKDSNKALLMSVTQAGAAPAPTYSVAFNAETGGSVTNPGTHTQATGTVSSTAVPSSGYTFAGWYKNGVRITATSTASDAYVSGNAITVKYNAAGAGTYTARFQNTPTPNYTVTFNAGTGGSVNGSGTHTGVSGTTFSATASPASGYNFTGWYKNGAATPVSTNATISITVNASETGNTYTAQFIAVRPWKDWKDLYMPAYDSRITDADWIMTVEEAIKLLTTKDAIYFDMNGPTWNNGYYTDNVVYWILKPQYRTGGLPYLPDGRYIPEIVPESVRTSGKYFFVPAAMASLTVDGKFYQGISWDAPDLRRYELKVFLHGRGQLMYPGTDNWRSYENNMLHMWNSGYVKKYDFSCGGNDPNFIYNHQYAAMPNDIP